MLTKIVDPYQQEKTCEPGVENPVGYRRYVILVSTSDELLPYSYMSCENASHGT